MDDGDVRQVGGRQPQEAVLHTADVGAGTVHFVGSLHGPVCGGQAR